MNWSFCQQRFRSNRNRYENRHSILAGKNKRKIHLLSRWSSYHGITLGALSLSGFYERRYRFTHLVERYPAISAPHVYRQNHKTEEDFVQAAADELETAIKRIGSQFIAGFVAEPIIGAAGAADHPPPGYYERLSEVCRTHEVLLLQTK